MTTSPGGAFDVFVLGGEADGAYFAEHALPWPPPATIEVAVGGSAGAALLDLPDDALELDEHVVVYALQSTGHTCARSGPHRGCRLVAGYGVPVSELDGLRRRRPRRPEDVAA